MKTPLQQLEEQARLGDKMKSFLKDGAYQILNDEILEPLDRAAFEAFKKVNARDELAVVETQMMSKIIDRIKKTIEEKIALGDYARQELLNYSTPGTDE